MASYTAQSREQGRAPLPMAARRDTWWLAPAATFFVFTAFVVYTTFRVFENKYYEWGPYLSPMYSPLLPFHVVVNLPLIGPKMISPAVYILLFPLLFRLTCYYYRKAYYRSFVFDPPGCAVPEPNPERRMRYTGERVFPLIAQNFHRFALYIAVLFIFILGWDAIRSFMWPGPDGTKHFGMGVGSLVLTINVVLLALYTFGCHSWRHLIGGSLNCYSCDALSRTRYGLWVKFSFLNRRHALFAWLSLIWVALTDLYVRLAAMYPGFDVRFF